MILLNLFIKSILSNTVTSTFLTLLYATVPPQVSAYQIQRAEDDLLALPGNSILLKLPHRFYDNRFSSIPGSTFVLYRELYLPMMDPFDDRNTFVMNMIIKLCIALGTNSRKRSVDNAWKLISPHSLELNRWRSWIIKSGMKPSFFKTIFDFQRNHVTKCATANERNTRLFSRDHTQKIFIAHYCAKSWKKRRFIITRK